MDGFEEVYLRHYHDVFLFLLRLTRDEDAAEELTQATFVQALLYIERFQEHCELRVWLCQIAKHLVYAQAKKQKREVPMPDDSAWEDPSSFPQALESQDDSLRLHLLLHKLEGALQGGLQPARVRRAALCENRRDLWQNRKLGQGYFPPRQTQNTRENGAAK